MAATIPTIRSATSRIRPTYSTVPWPLRAERPTNRRVTSSRISNLLGLVSGSLARTGEPD
jgi:hypothetical protein